MSELTLKGKWINQLKSIMNITEFGDNKLSGIYYTSVGEVKKGVGNPLDGSYNIEIWTDDKGNKYTTFQVTFNVQWINRKEKGSKPSCTSWNGQVDLSKDGETVDGIDTAWILGRFTTSPDKWDRVGFGKDYFVPFKKTLL
jgi:Tol biopolymer transport system component